MALDMTKCVDRIEALPKWKAKGPSLEETIAYYDYLGRPGEEIPFIQVAGSNGKGSTCFFLAYALAENGYKVGLFTSPHLVEEEERIRILEKSGETVESRESIRDKKARKCHVHVNQIPGERFRALEESLLSTLQEAVAIDGTLTMPEAYFLLAMQYFAEEKPDILILETGLGGRYDAVTLLPHPLALAITSISLEHTAVLGDTIEAIAGEKGAILRNEAPVFCGDLPKGAKSVINNLGKQRNCPVSYVDKSRCRLLQNFSKAVDFSYESKYYSYERIALSAAGLYQMENAAIALDLLGYLQQNGKLNLKTEDILRGVEEMTHPGRMEQVSPHLYVDGAHNPEGIRAFLDTVKQMPAEGKRILIFAVMADKSYEEMLTAIRDSHLFAKVLVTGLQDERSLKALGYREVLERLFADPELKIEMQIFPSLSEAYDEARREISDGGEIFFTGSLHLVGEWKKQMGKI